MLHAAERSAALFSTYYAFSSFLSILLGHLLYIEVLVSHLLIYSILPYSVFMNIVILIYSIVVSTVPISLPKRKCLLSTFVSTPRYLLCICTQLYIVPQSQKICGLSSSGTFNISLSSIVKYLPSSSFFCCSSVILQNVKFPIYVTKMGYYSVTIYHPLVPNRTN
jgi:hypothetical protein